MVSSIRTTYTPVKKYNIERKYRSVYKVITAETLGLLGFERVNNLMQDVNGNNALLGFLFLYSRYTVLCINNFYRHYDEIG